jgi:hypothetical protein
MDDADRRHAVGVARRVVASLGPGTPRAVVAAALLHDVGKIEAGLGTWRRVVATVAGVASHRARRSDGPIGRYLRHGDLGAELLAGANSSPLTVAWAREHHLPRRLWTVDADVAVALKAADDD